MSYELIMMALAEDIGEGDITSAYFVPEDKVARALITARGEGVISGMSMAEQVFTAVDPNLEIQVLIDDGSKVSAGAVLMKIDGKARSILAAERTALNFLQRLSGVASVTAKYVAAVKHTPTKILDTRKTAPAYRALEKKAVMDGGGTNHRMGLFDRAMVKDNHLATEGDLNELQAGINRLKSDIPNVEVEVEADSLEQVREFLKLKDLDYILLDNMSLSELREAVKIRDKQSKIQFEASGGVNLETVTDIAETGVDFISVGALTHSSQALDIGLDFVPVD